MLERFNPGTNSIILSLILLNLALLFVYRGIRNNKGQGWSLMAIVLFCVFAFWNSDYSSYMFRFFYFGPKDYEEPFYYYLTKLSFNNYYIYRFLIWGLATTFMYLAIKRFDIDRNISLFIFTIFFLMTFSYARSSLAMSSYVFGISFFIVGDKKFKNFFLGSVFVILSYFFHRSFLPIIALAPFLAVPLNRKTLFLIIAAIPLLFYIVNYYFGSIVGEQLLSGDYFDAFNNAVNKYTGRDVERLEYNWKFQLVNNLRNYSFYVAIVLLLYVYIKNRNLYIIDRRVEKCLLLSSLIIVLGSLFFFDPDRFLHIVGYRYLYISGLPLIMATSILYEDGILSDKQLFIILIMPFLYSEGFLIGKLI